MSNYIKKFDFIAEVEEEPIEEMGDYLELAFNQNEYSPRYMVDNVASVMQARRNKLMKEGNSSGAMHEVLIRSLTEEKEPSFKTVAEALDTFGYRITIAPKIGKYSYGPPILNGVVNETKASRKSRKKQIQKQIKR